MDRLVEEALKKWPDVPSCTGWLALDARGDWYMRDERVQAQGAFATAKGSRVEHEKLREFIARNYAADADGAWFFQNGPQRVYVELECAPWVWRLGTAASSGREVFVKSHTGRDAEALSTWTDERGRLFIDTDIGFGIVHTLDMETAADMVEDGLWEPMEGMFATFPERFGFRLSPAATTR